MGTHAWILYHNKGSLPIYLIRDVQYIVIYTHEQ